MEYIRRSTVKEAPAQSLVEKAAMISLNPSKRVIDIVGALGALVLTAPIMIVAAVLIKIESWREPILFVQERHGRQNKIFKVYKLRSMCSASAQRRFRQANREMDRITWLGNLLRKTSIDELPQLINVLRGDMSLVGPRPHPVAMNEQFFDKIDDYMLRHTVRPGITGLAQVSGSRGPAINKKDITKRLKYDLEYIERWSPWLDLKIMVKTAMVLIDLVSHKTEAPSNRDKAESKKAQRAKPATFRETTNVAEGC